MDTLSGSVTVNGTELHYVIEGSGIPCIIDGSAIYHPRTFSQELRQYFKFVFMDQRAYNSNIKRDDAKKITLNTLVDDIEAVRIALGLGKIAVLGHSIHGLIALEYARKYSQNTSHVIMIGTPPCGASKFSRIAKEFWDSEASDERKMIHEKNWENVTEEVLNELSPSEAFRKASVTDGAKIWYDPNYDCSWLLEGVEVNMDVVNQIFGVIFNEYNLTEGPGQIETPVFLAMGKHDYTVPYTLWDEEKDKLPNLSFTLFEKSGHTPHLEEQTQFDKKLIDWVSS